MLSVKTATRFYSVTGRFSWEENCFPPAALRANPFWTLPWWCLPVSKGLTSVSLIHFLPHYIIRVSSKQTSSVKHYFSFKEKKKGGWRNGSWNKTKPIHMHGCCSPRLIVPWAWWLCQPVFLATAFPALPWKTFDLLISHFNLKTWLPETGSSFFLEIEYMILKACSFVLLSNSCLQTCLVQPWLI